MSRIKDLGGAGPRTGSDFDIALTAITDTPGLSTATLTATPSGNIGTVTYVWTLLGPDETSQTTLIADATAASTTAVLASIASGQRAGLWTAQCVATDAAGQAVTKTVQWIVGVEGWLMLESIDLTAGEVQDLLGIASGATFVIDGATRVHARSGTVSSCTVGGGSGLKTSFNGSGAYVNMRRSFANLISGYGIEDDVMVLYRRVTGTSANTNHLDRAGWYGGREVGCEAKHNEGSRIATNFGGWVFGTAAGSEPTIIGFRRRGRDFTGLSSTAASGWPAFSALTKVGYAGLLQDGNDADAVATGDTSDLFITQGVIATARTNAEFTAQSVWKKM